MAHEFQGEYKRTLAAKLGRMGAHGEFPPSKADRLAKRTGNVGDTARVSMSADPERLLREGKLLSTDPIKAVRQLYTPEKVK